MQVTDDNRTEFLTHGATKLTGFLDEAELSACRECIEWMVRESPNASKTTQKFTAALETTLPTFTPMLQLAPWAEMLASAWGSSNVWYYDNAVFVKKDGKAGRTPLHRDTHGVPFAGEHLAVCWVSLDSVPAQHALEFVKGSHRDQPAAFDNLGDYFAARTTGLPSGSILSWATEPGDVILFHPNVIHGGAAVDSGFPARHTLTLRFFGDDAFVRKLGSFVLPPCHRMDLRDGELFRHPQFLQLRGAGSASSRL